MEHRSILLDQSSTAEQRIQATFQLLKENTDNAANTLIHALENDPSPIVRHECAYCLGEMDPKRSFSALVQAIEHDENIFVVHEASLALGNLGVIEGKEILENLLNHNDNDLVLTARISLQRLDMKLEPPSHQQIDASDIILDPSSSEENRVQAAFVLLRENSETAINYLLKALEQEIDPIVKHEIIFALGETADKRVIPHLIDHMRNDPNVFVKHEAALALATLGDHSAKHAIRELLDHPNKDVIETAEIALERLLS